MGLADVRPRDLPHLDPGRLDLTRPDTLPPIGILGDSVQETREGIELLAKQVHTSAWNLSRRVSRESLLATREVDATAEAHGVDLRCVVDAKGITAEVVDLMTTGEIERFRVGPVTQPLILLDRLAVIVDGPLGPSGERSAWLVTETQSVRLAEGLFTASWRAAERISSVRRTEPLPDGPTFTQRQRAVMRLLREGRSASAIAGELRVAPRTIVYDVKAITAALGATGRVDLGYRIRVYEEAHPEP